MVHIKVFETAVLKTIKFVEEFSETNENLKNIKGLYTLDILTNNIAIKRYCDKKIILCHGCLKAKVSS